MIRAASGSRRPLAWLVPALLAGCAPVGQADLVVATDLPRPEARALESAFRAEDREGAPPRLAWIFVEPGDDPARLAGGALPIDLVIHASAASPAEDGPIPASSWRMFRRGEVGLAVNREVFESRAMVVPSGRVDLGDPTLAGLVAIDDPRRDPAALALAAARLAEGPWADGYSALVRAAAQAPPIGRGNSAPALLARGDVALAVTTGDAATAEDPGAFLPQGPGPVGAAATVAGTPHEAAAGQFLAFLASRARDGGPPAREATGLLGDLLGSTLVDSQPELTEAARAIARRDAPGAERLLGLLGEAPPWPPASVAGLREDDPGGGLVEDLTAQLAPDLGLRYWLLQSWDAPPRPIDGELLETLATAVDGRLAAEPRFRAWLRGEWTAWARQRYRRVERRAAQAGAAAEGRP